MAELTVNDRPALIVANISTTLRDATVGGSAVFASVGVFSDVGSFERVVDPKKGPAVAIIAKQPERGPAMDNADDHTCRLQVDVAVRFESVPRRVGADGTAAATEMTRLADLIRLALQADRSRGGQAQWITWSGNVLEGTDLRGQPRLVGPRANQAFYTAVVPIACGWAVPR